MAKVFRFTPKEVDEMQADQVIHFLWLENEWRKKEQDDSKSQSRLSSDNTKWRK